MAFGTKKEKTNGAEVGRDCQGGGLKGQQKRILMDAVDVVYGDEGTWLEYLVGGLAVILQV